MKINCYHNDKKFEKRDGDWYSNQPFVSRKKAGPATAHIFHIIGNRLLVMSMPAIVRDLKTKSRWTAEELEREPQHKLVNPPLVEEFVKC